MGNKLEKNRFERIGDIVHIFRRGRTWYANFQLDGKQRRQSLRTISMKEARRRAVHLESDILQGRYQMVKPPPALATVVQEYKEFLKTERRAPKTLIKYTKVFDRLLDLAGRRGARTIRDVDLQFLDAYRRERVQAGAAPKTVFTETVVVRQLVNFAMSRGLLADDPLKGLRLKKPGTSQQPCWTATQVETILAASRDAERAKLTMLADTGMRIGELRHLTWDDVDWDHNVIHIRPKEDWRPKTGDQRAIPMGARVRRILQSLPRRSNWVFTAAPSKKYPGGDQRISERRLLASLKRVLAKLGLPGHLHTFRHAFISNALTSGIPEAIVRQWVGHIDAQIIRLYTHIADAASQTAMQRLAASKDSPMHSGGTQNGSASSDGNSAQNQHSERRVVDDNRTT